MSKPTYERRVLQLNPKHILVHNCGHGRKDLIREYCDTKSIGLTLRVRGRQSGTFADVT